MARSAGEAVLVRDVHDGHISAALPVVVVEESDERVVIWLRAGTPVMWLGAVPMPAWIDAGRPLVAKEWDDNDRLTIWERGASHTVSFFREAASGNEACWYVDLCEPWVETRAGWDCCDQELDIVAWPDLSQWWWKDVDEFQERIDHGYVSAERATELRAEAATVIAALEARQGVWAEADAWRAWRPDPAWAIPSLPDDWASIPR
jgi:hypothetical protein